MARFIEGAIFEYCENLYDELEKADGGCYPSKHDNLVLQNASEHFGIPIDEIEKKYQDYKALVAKNLMQKINRMPKKKRQAVIRRKAQDILLNNRDLPFGKIEGGPSEKLSSSLDDFFNDYKELIEKTALAEWTIPLTIGINKLDTIKKCSDDVAKLDAFFIDFYSGKEFPLMCKHIQAAIENVGQRKRFEECIDTYKQGMYSTSLTTLTSVLEGLLSCYSDNPQDVRIKKICMHYVEEEKNKHNMIRCLCWTSMLEYTKVLFEKSDFSQNEPGTTNRHWILHGRTSKIGQQADCLRLFNALSTIACIKAFESKIQ